jgi:protocatechuate 3,4-dioxygenase beta subunit
MWRAILLLTVVVWAGPLRAAEGWVTWHDNGEQSDPSPHITGTVRDPAGVPVAGVIVSFHPGHYPNAPDDTETTTDKNGRYELTLKMNLEPVVWSGAIMPTSCILVRSVERNLAAIAEFDALPMEPVSPPASLPAVATPNFPRPILHGTQSFPTNLDLSLQPGISISGDVQDTEGKPISNALMMVRVEAGGTLVKVLERPILVDAQGAFSIPALPQGRGYDVWEATARGYGEAAGRLVATETRTNRAAFRPFVLKRADQTLAGRVLGPDGEPVAGASIYYEGAGQPQLTNSIRSDREGRFIFDGVCAGKVILMVTAVGPPPAPGMFNVMNGGAAAQGGDTNVVVRVK